jgi:triosephosphate isomerase
MRKFIFGCNWKMQILKIEEACKIADAIAKSVEDIPEEIEIYIAPSFTALAKVGEVLKGTRIKLAAQNMYFQDSGAFTGEIAADSLLDAGCEYVILGHSERRRIFNEDNSGINQKVKKALEKGLKPVLCIGETARERNDGLTEEVNRSQLEESLADVEPDQMQNVVIAYEPVWAINNKFLNPDVEIKTATPEQAQEVHQFIRQWLVDKFGEEIGSAVPIEYGGSMNGENAAGLLEITEINGGLIGSASLAAEKFRPIIDAALNLQ